MLGNGTQLKPYIHVDDLLDAIQLGITQPANPMEVYNVAGEGATTVREMAELVKASRLRTPSLNRRVRPRLAGGMCPSLHDTSKIHSLGWKPKRNSREAVEASIKAEVEKLR